jgi:HTH-type transcriptional regulator / antitoxin HigA
MGFSGTKERTPAEGFLPGDLIKDELEARGWTQEDLAEIMGRTTTAVNEIIVGKRGITVETAKGLAGAFGTSAQFWLNMESAYRLSLEKSKPDIVVRKAILYGIAPIRGMIKRNWIEPSTNIEVLEQRLCEFFSIKDIVSMQPLRHTARKSTVELTPAQNAWLFRAKHLAEAVSVEQYTKAKLNVALKQLKTMLKDESNISLIPKILGKAGVKFLIIEPLPQSKIDGASFWVDGCPVVALSLRYNRIDSLWHTLMHELGHIRNEDGLNENRMVVDTDLFDNENDDQPYEKAADEFAVTFLVAREEMDDFIARTQPLYSKTKIVGFANRIEVHPGIVVGQLHHLGASNGGLDYSQNREMLVKIRHLIVSVALTDGYGQSLSINLN